MPKNYYEILGVDKSATIDDIKKAYRKIALECHPDRTNGDKVKEDLFKSAAEAYEVLSNTDKRKHYDTFGVKGDGQNPFAGGNPFNGGGQFTDFGDIFSQFGFGKRKTGTDIQITIGLTLEEVFTGVTKTVKYKINHDCKSCNGSGAKTTKKCMECGGNGFVARKYGNMVIRESCQTCYGSGNQIDEFCMDCKGSGLVKNESTQEVRIPAGFIHDMIVIKGGGNNKGGLYGDLIVRIGIKHHEYFGVDGNDIILNTNINFIDMILGGTSEIPVIDGGNIKITIPSGSQPGAILRIRGKGMNFNGRGDMLVRLNTKFPKTINEKELKWLTELKKSENFK